MTAPRGLTLLELLAAASIGLIVIAVLGRVDLTRVKMMRRSNKPVLQEGLVSEAGLSWLEVARQLEQADRVVLSNPASPSCRPSGSSAQSSECYQTVQLRIPRGKAFGETGNYRWFQYRFSTDGEHGRIAGYADSDHDCTPDVVFKDISGMSLQFHEVAKAPPHASQEVLDGPEDDNMLNLTISSVADEVTFTGVVAPRAIAYTNVGARCEPGEGCDTGVGLAPPGVSGPPRPCG